MRVTIQGHEVEMSVTEFRELFGDSLAPAANGTKQSVADKPHEAADKSTAADHGVGDARLPSRSKREAMQKLYRGLRASMHKNLLKSLAAKGGRAIAVDEIRKELRLHNTFKMSGFTAAIRRRAPLYGLRGEEVLLVDFRGTVAGQRVYLYKLAPGMLDAMRELGLPTGDPAVHDEGGEHATG